MQSEAKVHYQDKAPKQEKPSQYLCDECGEPISKQNFQKDGLCNVCRGDLGIN